MVFFSERGFINFAFLGPGPALSYEAELFHSVRWTITHHEFQTSTYFFVQYQLFYQCLTDASGTASFEFSRSETVGALEGPYPDGDGVGMKKIEWIFHARRR